MQPVKLKKPPLRQADIDAPTPYPAPHPVLDYLYGVPGIILTIAVLVAFVVSMWALYSLWGGGEVYRAVTSAGRG